MPELAKVKEDIRQATEQLKVPPHSIEAEQAVLGAILLDPSAIAKALEYVREASFYWTKHQYTANNSIQ